MYIVGLLDTMPRGCRMDSVRRVGKLIASR
jgi:hypothetical protein